MMDILYLVLLITCNGLLALAEIAVISSDINIIRSAAEKGNRNARIVEQFKQNPQKFLSSIQVGITLVGILAGAFGAVRLSEYLLPVIISMGIPENWAFRLSVITIIVTITFFNILFGELVPKTIALQYPERMAIKLSKFISVFSRIFSPVVYILTKSTKIVSFLIGIPEQNQRDISEDEIRTLIKLANRQGVLEKKETELLQNIFRFANRYAQQIMTPAKNIAWLDINDDIKSRSIIYKSAHTKYLVCDGNINNVSGYLNIRDVFMNELDVDFSIKNYLSTPVILSKQDNALEILEKFSVVKCYFGVVKDFDRRVLGIITLHDLIEGIFGILPMKGRVVEMPIHLREDGSLLVSGSVLVDEIMDLIALEPPIDDTIRFETIAHLMVSNQPGIIPKGGHVLRFNNLCLEIVDVDGIEIDKVLIYISSKK